MARSFGCEFYLAPKGEQSIPTAIPAASSEKRGIVGQKVFHDIGQTFGENLSAGIFCWQQLLVKHGELGGESLEPEFHDW